MLEAPPFKPGLRPFCLMGGSQSGRLKRSLPRQGPRRLEKGTDSASFDNRLRLKSLQCSCICKITSAVYGGGSRANARLDNGVWPTVKAGHRLRFRIAFVRRAADSVAK